MGRTNQTDELDDPLIVMIDGKRTKFRQDPKEEGKSPTRRELTESCPDNSH